MFLDKIELMVVNEKNRFNMYIFNKSEKNSILKKKQFENCKMFEKNYLNKGHVIKNKSIVVAE